MNRGVAISVCALACVLSFGGNLLAHHGGAAWDMKTMLNVQGTVTEFRFVNPHVQIFLDATDDKGKPVHWSCESADPAMLVRQGWTRETVKPGDHVTLVGHPAKTGVKIMVLEKLILANGKEVPARAVVN
jgi:hypothetical protein